MLYYGCCGAALVLAISALFFYLPDKSAEDIARLERLAGRIERAQALAPEAQETIERLVARQSALTGSGRAEREARRKAAIERMTRAINAKSAAAMASHAQAR
jgi:hypothetical protein